MLRLEHNPARFDAIIKEINTDVGDRLTAGITAAAQAIPDIIRLNIDTEGAALGGKWEKVPIGWLQKRQTWPGSQSGPLDATQESYIRNHIPLRDTDTLYNSFRVMGVDKTKGAVTARISTSVTYGRNHDQGIPGPGGPKELHERKHMFITPGELPGINEAIEGAF